MHPVLAAMLAEWKLRGWEEMVGKAPTADDLIIPSRTGELRSRHHSRNKLLDDLKRLGLRHRRGHDLRRTFITLARVDGARKDLLEIITHSQRGNIIDIYTSMPWASLCEEVAKLKIERRTGKVLSMPKVMAGGGSNGGITGNNGEGGGSTASPTVTEMKGGGAGEEVSNGRLTTPRTSGAAIDDQPQENAEETMVEAPGIEPSARRVENGRKWTQTDGNGRGSAGLSGKMRPFRPRYDPMRPLRCTKCTKAYACSRRWRSRRALAKLPLAAASAAPRAAGRRRLLPRRPSAQAQQRRRRSAAGLRFFARELAPMRIER